MILILFTVRNN